MFTEGNPLSRQMKNLNDSLNNCQGIALCSKLHRAKRRRQRNITSAIGECIKRRLRTICGTVTVDMAVSARMSLFADNGYGEQEKDANSQLVELDKGTLVDYFSVRIIRCEEV